MKQTFRTVGYALLVAAVVAGLAYWDYEYQKWKAQIFWSQRP